MKALDIALKDTLRTVRSPFALAMMFAAPLLITGLLYFAFGGILSGGDEFALPLIRVQVASLDEAGAGGVEAGRMLISFLQDESLADVLALSEATGETEARAAVDAQEADVALVIPAGFSKAVMAPGTQASVLLYQDPTLTIGPRIVDDLVSHFLDGFSGARIAVEVTAAQLADYGLGSGAGSLEQAALRYSTWLNEGGHQERALAIQPPPGRAEDSTDGASILRLTMAGMMIFFVFFMGAHGAASLIREDEDGTLARLFTTPTPRAAILGGKFVAIFLALIIQVAVLLLASRLLLNIRWGQAGSVVLASLSLIVAATGFGVLLMALVKNTRQTGPVVGGVLPLLGMAGGLFTIGMPSLPAAFNTITLVTPHGWALRAWKLALAGAAPQELLASALVLGAAGVIFFVAGAYLFRRRFS